MWALQRRCVYLIVRFSLPFRCILSSDHNLTCHSERNMMYEALISIVNMRQICKYVGGGVGALTGCQPPTIPLFFGVWLSDNRATNSVCFFYPAIDTLRKLYTKSSFCTKNNGRLRSMPFNKLGVNVNQAGVASGLLFKSYTPDLETYTMSIHGLCIRNEIIALLLWTDDQSFSLIW